MPTPRWLLAVGVVNGILRAVGGNNFISSFLATVEAFTTTVPQVQIEVKPGIFPNIIDLSGHGLLPVAILTTPNFNAADVNVEHRPVLLALFIREGPRSWCS